MAPGLEGSHETVLTAAKRAVTAGASGHIRVVMARDPAAPHAEWRPACGRLDLCSNSDPPPSDCRPRGAVRILEERLPGAELIERVARSMSGEPFRVLDEILTGHGMESHWSGFHRLSRWDEEGASWPVISLAPSSQIAHRPQIYEIIEDNGPSQTFTGLDALVRHVMGFLPLHGPGLDARLSRFQLVAWDYRGRIDTFEFDSIGRHLRVAVTPKDERSLRLVGLVSGQRARKPIVVAAPSTTIVSLDEPILRAQIALKCADDTVAEVSRDFVQEMQVAILEGRMIAPDPSAAIFDAIERSLRPVFQAAPTREQEVQAAVEQILRPLNIPFHREKERAPLGATSFIPDFTVPDISLAIEIKLATSRHTEALIQRELTQDAAAYGTKWQRFIAVVYDVAGVIRDPERMRHACEQLGIWVVIVKH